MKKLLNLFISLLFVVTNISCVFAEGPVSNDYCAIVYTSDGENKNFINIFDAWEYADDNLKSELVLLHNVFTNGDQLEDGTNRVKVSYNNKPHKTYYEIPNTGIN